MPDTKQRPEPWLDSELISFAIDFVLAMMRSASTRTIDPRHWWERAKSALETGAACAETFGQMVSKMGAKLEIESPLGTTASSISSLAERLADPPDFEAFRSICERDALFIVAMARAKNDERKRGPGETAEAINEVLEEA